MPWVELMQLSHTSFVGYKFLQTLTMISDPFAPGFRCRHELGERLQALYSTENSLRNTKCPRTASGCSFFVP